VSDRRPPRRGPDVFSATLSISNIPGGHAAVGVDRRRWHQNSVRRSDLSAGESGARMNPRLQSARLTDEGQWIFAGLMPGTLRWGTYSGNGRYSRSLQADRRDAALMWYQSARNPGFAVIEVEFEGTYGGTIMSHVIPGRLERERMRAWRHAHPEEYGPE